MVVAVCSGVVRARNQQLAFEEYIAAISPDGFKGNGVNATQRLAHACYERRLQDWLFTSKSPFSRFLLSSGTAESIQTSACRGV